MQFDTHLRETPITVRVYAAQIVQPFVLEIDVLGAEGQLLQWVLAPDELAALCGEIARHRFGICPPPAGGDSMTVQLADPEATPEMKALQIRYQQIIGKAMIETLKEYKSGADLAMVNALGHHLVLCIRSLNERGHLIPGTIDRMADRLKILANEGASKGEDS